MFMEALKVCLERTYSLVGVVGDGRAMVEEAIRVKPDAVIVDVGMPCLNGLDAAKRVQQKTPTAKFIFLTAQDAPNMAAAALELGPIGFLNTHSPASELLKAIDHVLRGECYLGQEMRPTDWVTAKSRGRRFWTEMTPRQRDVAQLLAEGRSAKEIAELLDVSPRTVEFHKQQIKDCFNLKSNADLVLFALKRGLISIDG
jgi:DNA-binding NarL/FixJ family response regulator